MRESVWRPGRPRVVDALDDVTDGLKLGPSAGVFAKVDSLPLAVAVVEHKIGERVKPVECESK